LVVSDNAKKAYDGIKKKLRIIDVLLCALALLEILISYFDNIAVITSYNLLSHRFECSDTNNGYRYVNLVLVLISLILLVKRYSMLLHIHKLKSGKISNNGILIIF
jgi:hypothetical protein